MYAVGKLAMVLLLTNLVSACSVTSAPPTDPSVLHRALTSWTHCLTQFTDAYEGSIGSIQARADAHCEGHKRDVLATFPAHLENQVDLLLSQKSSVFTTARYLKTGTAGTSNSSQGSRIDTYRDRLIEARRVDL